MALQKKGEGHSLGKSRGREEESLVEEDQSA
jgi:hypothetical protein